MSERIGPKQRRQHLEFAAKYLAQLAGLESMSAVTLRHDPDEAFDLMTLSRPGVLLVMRILADHRCSPTHDVDGICPLLYLAWVIEGCPDDGETIEQSLRRNTIRREQP